MKEVIIILAVVFLFFAFLVWAMFEARKKVVKDWKTLEYLKEKANNVNTKDEIEEFHREFLEKTKKINNPHINIELQIIDAYLRGLYKQFKT